MLKNFINATLRSFKKNLGFTIINMMGLSIGLACSVLIMIFVWYELSYDRFNEKTERIYRISQKALIGNTQINQTWTPAPMPEALYKEFPEIESITRITDAGRQTVNFEDKVFVEKRILIADSTLFEVFTFPFTQGVSGSALNQPNIIVITESMAKKYFGNEDPIGRTLRVRDSQTDLSVKVSAVIKDIPENSHFHFDFVISMTSFKGLYDSGEWFHNNFRTYFVLQSGFSIKDLERKIPAFTNKYLFDGKYEEMKSKKSGYWEIYFQPLEDIHLNSDISGEFEPNGKRSYVYIFFVVAIIILLIACINFMNLNTAKSSTRAREVGVRKVVGARRRSLVIQFVSESILTSLIALGLGMAVAETLLPAYGNLIGRHLEIHYFNNYYVLPFLVLLALFVGLFSGSYPAFFLSSFKPINVLKGKLQGGTKRPWLRNTLVIIQFTISIVLIIGTLVIFKQLNYLQKERLGFDKEQVILLRNPFALGKNTQVFREELKNYQGIRSVSFSTSIPGKPFNNIGFNSDGKDGFTLNICICDQDFQDAMGLEMIDGRFFSNTYPSDSTAIIINEAAAKLLEWDMPLGKIIKNSSSNPTSFKVIGVVKDFYYESKHQKIRPMALFIFSKKVSDWSPNYISVRLKSGKYDDAISYIDKSWKKFANDLPIEYTFLSEEYDMLYKNEKQTKQLFVVFSILAIFIACLGLLGLTSYMAEQRTKEIGIRKVMGASVSTITLILSANFTRWVLLSNLFAWPIAYYLMTKWLEDFAYRVSISWWIFVVAGLLSILIALITISYQSIKAATRNPIESLRYE